MEEFLVPFGILTAVGVPLILKWLAEMQVEREAEWDPLTRDSSLENVVRGHVRGWSFWPITTKLTATSGPLHVSVEARRSASGIPLMSIVVSRLGFQWPEATIRPESIGTALREARGQRDIEVGTAPFDDHLYVEGQRAFVQALLDEPSRNRILKLPLDGLQVHVFGDTLEVVALRERVGDALATALALAGRLSTLGHLPTRLAENAKRDPLAKVRLANLLTLEREYAALPLTREALRAALADDYLVIRLRAAVGLGEEGRETLLKLAGGPRVPEDLAIDALRALGANIPQQHALSVLEASLRSRRVSLARECIQVLGQPSEEKTALEKMVQILSIEEDALAAAAAAALGKIGDPLAEGPLVEALARDDVDARLAAARALGQLGSVAAVAALRGVEEGSDSELRHAVREAIARIQSRIAGAGAGQLSLTAGSGGELSIAAGSGGELSIAAGNAQDPSLPELTALEVEHPPAQKPKLTQGNG